MKTVTLKLTQLQLEAIMRAMSSHLAELIDEDGNVADVEYFDLVRDTYFHNLNNLQAEFK